MKRIAFVLLLASLPAQARVLKGQVLLKGLERELLLIQQEPGTEDQLVLDQVSYQITSADPEGNISAMLETQSGGMVKLETVDILTDPTLLASFKAAPYWAAMSLAFLNAKEVRCPGTSTGILMHHSASAPRKTVGNCVTLSSDPP